MKHLLSVIVPVYNAERYLSECLDSILNQSYTKLEVILVDDGSTDNSSMICDQYKEKDGRIRVIHKINEGCSIARNIGIENAKGDLVAFVDSDDTIDKRMYELLINDLDSTNADVVACTFVKEYETNKQRICDNTPYIPTPLVFEGNEIYISITRQENSLEGYIWNKVWKRELIGNHRFRQDIVMCEDSIFTWETLKEAKRACYCDLPMYHYLIQEQSVTRNSSVEKYMGALTSYELMLADEKILPQEVVNNLSKQYLGWNLFIFGHLIKQKHPNMEIYKRLKGNCFHKRDYIFMLRPASRLCAKKLAMRGYRQAKITVCMIGKMLEMRDKMRKKTKTN